MVMTNRSEDSMNDEKPTALLVESPVGTLELTAAAGALTGIRLPRTSRRAAPTRPLPPVPVPPSRLARGADDPARQGSGDQDARDGSAAVLEEARRQLGEFFAGERRAFDLPLSPRGTAFQRTVWESLRSVGYGQTTTYGELAHAMGKPAAARAVGAALGQNPLPIVVPCHRVIGATGDLTGFGGGLAMKRFLLDLEAGATPLA
jgi:methylated-DNA-[protein]-cysteine S-methyltransferase